MGALLRVLGGALFGKAYWCRGELEGRLNGKSTTEESLSGLAWGCAWRGWMVAVSAGPLVENNRKGRRGWLLPLSRRKNVGPCDTIPLSGSRPVGPSKRARLQGLLTAVDALLA